MLGFFIPFFLLGLCAYLIVPPPKVPQKFCSCFVCNWYMSDEVILVWILFFCCLVFTIFIMVAGLVFNWDRYVASIPDWADGANLYGYPLLVAMGAALVSLFTSRSFWAVIGFSVFITYIVAVYAPCEEGTRLCFFERSILSLFFSGVLTAAASALIARCFGDVFCIFLEHVVISFTMVFSLLCCIKGFAYWQDKSLSWPLIATTIATFLRFVYFFLNSTVYHFLPGVLKLQVSEVKYYKKVQEKKERDALRNGAEILSDDEADLEEASKSRRNGKK